MHIMEGFLPSPWWQIWLVLSVPFLVYGMIRVRYLIRERRETLPLLALSGAFVFVLSSLKIPSVTGSSSHPTGTGLSAILFGTVVTTVLSSIVLLYQALFLAHGGITTFGANLFAMGVAGPAVAAFLYRGALAARVHPYLSVGIAAAVADLVTYLVTSFQLALAFPASEGGFFPSFVAFAVIFAITQVPLAIIEGIVISLTFRYIVDVRPEILVKLRVLSDTTVREMRRVDT